MEYRFRTVDVFTDQIFGGNQLAVFLDAEGLTEHQMQRIAREMNLAETTFVFPTTVEGCVCRVRIFTPGRELPMAGHPTVGTSYVLGSQDRLPGDNSSFELEEGIGPVAVRIEGSALAPDFVWMTQRVGPLGEPVQDRERVASMVGLTVDDLADYPIRICSAGAPFIFIPVVSPETVDDALPVGPDVTEVAGAADAHGFFVFAVSGENSFHSRMFGTNGLGISEDPATGGASGPLGAYAVAHGLVHSSAATDGTRLVSRQGVKMGRPSTVHITVFPPSDDGSTRVDVGGAVVPVMEGRIRL